MKLYTDSLRAMDRTPPYKVSYKGDNDGGESDGGERDKTSKEKSRKTDEKKKIEAIQVEKKPNYYVQIRTFFSALEMETRQTPKTKQNSQTRPNHGGGA